MVDKGWTWLTRGLAVLGFLYLILDSGLDRAPWGLYVLLMGLFFGPEVIKGQIRINRDDQEQKPK